MITRAKRLGFVVFMFNRRLYMSFPLIPFRPAIITVNWWVVSSLFNHLTISNQSNLNVRRRINIILSRKSKGMHCLNKRHFIPWKAVSTRPGYGPKGILRTPKWVKLTQDNHLLLGLSHFHHPACFTAHLPREKGMTCLTDLFALNLFSRWPVWREEFSLLELTPKMKHT